MPKAAKPGLAGSLTAAQRDRATENLLSFTYDDYVGQVLEYLEPAGRERYGSEKCWTDVVERCYALLAAAPARDDANAAP